MIASLHPDEAARDRELRPHATAAAGLVELRVGDARAHARLGDVATAARRLDELAAGLARELADGRAKSYRAAIGAAGLSPDESEETVARSARIGGREAPGDRIRRAIAEAKRSLKLHAGTPGEDLAAWAAKYRRSIEVAARGELSDGQMALWNAVYQIVTGGE